MYIKIDGYNAAQVTNIVSFAARERGIKPIFGNGRGNYVSFVLRPESEKYRKIGRNERRINAVCWHGHLSVLRAIYSQYPNAIVQSSTAAGKVVYRSWEDLEEKKWLTANMNIGSMFEPIEYKYACHCD